MELIKEEVTIEVVDHEATGELVRKTRKLKDLSLSTLAGRTGLSVSYLSRLESGQSTWTETLLKIISDGIEQETRR